jgi:hypothetical protein
MRVLRLGVLGGGDNGNDAVVQRFGLRSGTWTALTPGIALRDGTARAKAKAKAKATANAGVSPLRRQSAASGRDDATLGVEMNGRI